MTRGILTEWPRLSEEQFDICAIRRGKSNSYLAAYDVLTGGDSIAEAATRFALTPPAVYKTVRVIADRYYAIMETFVMEERERRAGEIAALKRQLEEARKPAPSVGRVRRPS